MKNIEMNMENKEYIINTAKQIITEEILLN